MANVELELQGAIVERLKADPGVAALVAGRVYDSVPQNAAFPYVTIGPVDSVGFDPDCIPGFDVAQQIDCWSRGVGFPECKKIADAVRAALHGQEEAMPLASNNMVFLEHRTTRITRDPDGLTSYGILGFEAAIEKELAMAQPTTAKFGKMQIMLGEASGADPAAVAVTSLSKTNPATCTVASADITKFQNGMTVLIAGAVGTGLTNANGSHAISSVGTPANTFTLVGVDTSTGAAPQTTGVTADPPKAIVYAAPCGFTSKNVTISKNLQEVNIPDCDDPDAPVWVGRDVQSQSCTITGDGVAAAESIGDWDSAAMSTSSVPMKVQIDYGTGGMKTITGNFHVDSEAFGADAGGRVTLAINAQSDGAVTAVWTGL